MGSLPTVRMLEGMVSAVCACFPLPFSNHVRPWMERHCFWSLFALEPSIPNCDFIAHIFHSVLMQIFEQMH